MASVLPIQADQVAILRPLVYGSVVVLCTIVIHAFAVSATVNLVRSEQRIGHVGESFGADLAIVVVATVIAFAAHLIEMAIWASLFVICGEFTTFRAAFDHSAVNYTTLGYGNVVMTPAWRLLGPLEAADGMLMFGVTTAMIFAVIQWLIRARIRDLRN